jgi:gas vesicle protein
MRDSKRIRYFWLGFGVGVSATTLFAPRSGAATRSYCQTKTHETADRLRRQAEELRDRAVKTMERGKHRFQHQLSRFSAAVDAGRSAYKKAS